MWQYSARRLIGILLVCLFAGSPGILHAKAAGGFQLERVVLLMRHGIRPPTKDPAKEANYAAQPWPSWPVDYGLLTPRGAAGVRLLAAADRADYVRRGLLPAHGCLPAGSVVAASSAKPRAIQTGEAFVTTLLPGCEIAVAHPQTEGPEDAMFHPLDSAADFDGASALKESLALAPEGGIAAVASANRARIVLLGQVLGCCSTAFCSANGAGENCDLTALPSAIVGQPHERPDLTGPLGIGSTVSQTFLMEYLEGMPMSQVGWGRVSPDQIEDLLEFHPLKFRYENGPPTAARRAGGPLARKMLSALESDGDSPRLMLLFGHDTNIADVGSLLGFSWHVPSYPANDIPPGAALGFELLRDSAGKQYVRAFFRAQTMDQLRNQVTLDPSDPAYRQYLVIPGCVEGADPCPLSSFEAVVQNRLGAN